MTRAHRFMSAAWFAVFLFLTMAQAGEATDLGSRRELFVDRHLIGSPGNVWLVLHRPEPREIVFRFNQPWEASCQLSFESRPAIRHPAKRFRLGTGSLHRWRVHHQAIYLFGHEVVAQLRHIGGLFVEIQTAEGKPVKGFSRQECRELIGDRIDQIVTWKNGTDVSRLAGKPVRLRVVMKDADLYSLQFSGSD